MIFIMDEYLFPVFERQPYENHINHAILAG